MSNIDERVKSIVVKQLSVKEEDVKNESKFIDPWSLQLISRTL